MASRKITVGSSVTFWQDFTRNGKVLAKQGEKGLVRKIRRPPFMSAGVDVRMPDGRDVLDVPTKYLG